jgi:hypothetical protein
MRAARTLTWPSGGVIHSASVSATKRRLPKLLLVPCVWMPSVGASSGQVSRLPRGRQSPRAFGLEHCDERPHAQLIHQSEQVARQGGKVAGYT